MTDLPFLAFRQGLGGAGWIFHVVVSAIIRGVVFGFIFRLIRQLTLGETVLLVIVVVVLLFAWARSRDRRGW